MPTAPPGPRQEKDLYDLFKRTPFADVLFNLVEVNQQLALSKNGETVDTKYITQLAILVTWNEAYASSSGRADQMETYARISQWYGGSLTHTLDSYARYVERQQGVPETTGPDGGAPVGYSEDSYLDVFGISDDPNYDFGKVIDEISTKQRLDSEFRKYDTREKTDPPFINPWECRIGLAKFLVPPTNVSIQNIYKTGSLTGGVLRQRSSAKFNSGHSETIIDMRLYFPNQDEVWGIGDKDRLEIDFLNDDDSVIDRFASSLRGLIAQFKFAPFLPIRHTLINSVYDITGVTMNSLSISTIPNFPLCYVVDLRMKAFNHKVYLPPIQDFNQAIDYGRLREYMGRAAQKLNAEVAYGFLTESPYTRDPDASNQSAPEQELGLVAQAAMAKENYDVIYDYNGKPDITFDREKDLLEGKSVKFYYPETTPGKLFTADLSAFRQYGEDNEYDKDKSSWERLLGIVGIDIDTTVSYSEIQQSANIGSGDFSARTALMEYLRALQIVDEVSMTNERLQGFINQRIEEYERDNGPASTEVEADIASISTQIWLYYLYGFHKNLPYVQALLDQKEREATNTIIREWEVPMREYVLDPSKIILEACSVSLQNNFASMQVQLQEEPTYQHIGGGDSTISFQFRVFGDEALIGFKRMLKHVNGLARLELSRGVLGFLGIKHILTSLCGIKYVLPLDFSVQSVEDVPNVYVMTLSFTDFDLLQQKREELSTAQQKELVEHFSKKNPFLRIKQMWGVFNAYPDFPLAVRDDSNHVVGHMDPDYYFRAFETIDDDIVKWGPKPVNKNADGITDAISVHPDGTMTFSDAIISHEIEENAQEEPTTFSDAIISHEIEDHQRTIDTTNTLADRLPGYTHQVDTYFPFSDQNGINTSVARISRNGVSLGNVDPNAINQEPTFQMENISFYENDASRNALHQTPEIEGLTPGSHQTPIAEDGDIYRHFELMMTDAQYRDLSGRMVRAFPTYMLWLIDEGGTFAGVKLFDNIYGLQSVIDFSLVQSEDILGDTLVLRLSNVYQKLTSGYKGKLVPPPDLAEELGSSGFESLLGVDSYPVSDFTVPGLADEDGNGLLYLLGNTYRNIISGTTDAIVDIERIRIKPGVRVHLRAGYSSNPNALETIFNGTITEVEQGDIISVTAQSDAIEFSPIINTGNKDGHSGSIDGSLTTNSDPLALWMSEPRDLMIRLLTMGASPMKEMIAAATDNLIFSENKFGIRHFGMMLYEPLSEREREKQEVRYNAVQAKANSFFRTDSSPDSSLDPQIGQGFQFDAFAGASSTRQSTLGAMTTIWANVNRDPDYEIYKRNIYPGNGYGIGQFLGGDMADGGLTIALAKSEDPTFLDQLNSPGSEDTEAETSEVYQSDIARRITEAGGDPTLQDALAQEAEENPSNSPPEVGPGSDNSLVEQGVRGIINFLGPGLTPGETASLAGWTPNQLLNILPGYDPDRDGDSLFNRMTGISKGLDDDPDGFDEVSFRAQTYMKSIWDLFQTCAALLPNYIVAVRPFEDRSTVFYGKPHWLYTSGVIPITTGISKAREASILRNKSMNNELENAMRDIAEKSSPLSDLEEQLTVMRALSTQVSGANDPSLPGGNYGNLDPDESGALNADQLADLAYTTGWKTEDEIVDFITIAWVESDWIPTRRGGAANGETNNMYGLMQIYAEMHKHMLHGKSFESLFDPVLNAQIAFQLYMRAGRSWRDWGEDNIGVHGGASDSNSGKRGEKQAEAVEAAKRRVAAGDNVRDIPSDGELPGPVADDSGLNVAVAEETTNTPSWYQPFETDPDKPVRPAQTVIEYEYRWGPFDKDVPVWIDPADGIYTPGAPSNVGDMARLLWDEGYNKDVQEDQEQKDRVLVALGTETFPAVIAENIDKDLEIAEEIWDDLRVHIMDMEVMKDAWAQVWTGPTGDDADDTDDSTYSWEEGEDDRQPKKVDGKYQPREYVHSVRQFLALLWNDPYCRAWIIVTANRKTDFGKLDQETANILFGGIIPKLTGADAPGLDIDVIFTRDNAKWAWPTLGGLFAIFMDNTVGSDNILKKDETTGIYKPSEAMYAYMREHSEPGITSEDPSDRVQNEYNDWFERNIGDLITAVASGIQGVITLFRQSMMALGYGLNMVGLMQKQSNALNKMYNDSIYYEAGNRPDSLVRLADNPFTREYGEPVVEVRESFQRVHYINSFQHILHNGIQESLENVPTSVTATSDGNHPVTVHFDKGIPSNLQFEKAVDTGIFWDSYSGKGFFASLHPLIHPIETARGFTKAWTGSSDELSSKRIALWHLKEGLKDIYQGEIMIIGNPDIRPHDLLYIADNYEQIQGMVEVEQVVHHFTPDMGFITSITPNAVVTINDPSRWNMISWMWSWFSVKEFRDSLRSKVYTIASDASDFQNQEGFNVDDLIASMQPSFRNHIQYTHGSSALVKDLAAAHAVGLCNVASSQDQQGLIGERAEAVSTLTTGVTSTFTFGLSQAVNDFAWDGWDWVRENLLDQQGCYIEYLNKNGEPMDAGLAYAQGVAVGRHHKAEILPGILGLSVDTKVDGHDFIRRDDLLAELGWSPKDFSNFKQYTSLWVDQVNSQLLGIINRSPGEDVTEMSDVVIGTVTQVQDVDTIYISPISGGEEMKIRLSGVAAPELKIHDLSSPILSPDNPAKIGAEKVIEILKEQTESNEFPTVAVRIDPKNQTDDYDRTLGAVFFRVPIDSPPENREIILERYAREWPPIPWDSYMDSGYPYTLNWEVIVRGFANTDTGGLFSRFDEGAESFNGDLYEGGN